MKVTFNLGEKNKPQDLFYQSILELRSCIQMLILKAAKHQKTSTGIIKTQFVEVQSNYAQHTFVHQLISHRKTDLNQREK